jgi:hypothetical protein
MNIFRILWDDPDDPDGNVQHVAEHEDTIRVVTAYEVPDPR